MPKTISHIQGKGSLSHNNRDFHYKNVDPDRTKDNITYARQTLSEAYEQCFGDSMRRYNENQGRADRRINDYYTKLFGTAQQTTVATATNKEKSFYETVVGIGNMYNSGVGTADGELAAKCLDEYMRGFTERNPNFHVFNAVLHMDEATPHLHINYIPIGHYNSGKGMDTRNSLSQALKEMGHGGGKDAINRWRIAERAVLKNICLEHGIEIAEEQKGRGYTLTPDEYKAQVEAEKAQLQQTAQQEIDAERLKLQNDLEAEKPVIEGKIALAKVINKAKGNMKESGFGKTKSIAFKGVSGEEVHAILKAAADRDDARIKEKNAVAKRDEAIAAKKVAEEKLAGIEKGEAAATKKQNEVNTLFEQQANLNQLYKQAVSDRDFHKSSLETEQKRNSELTAMLEKRDKNIKNQAELIGWFKSELTAAYQDNANIIMAMAVLNNDSNDGYMIQNLDPKSNRLINGITNYAAARTRQAAIRARNNYNLFDLQAALEKSAESMDKHMKIDAEIGKYVKALEPKVKSKSYER